MMYTLQKAFVCKIIHYHLQYEQTVQRRKCRGKQADASCRNAPRRKKRALSPSSDSDSGDNHPSHAASISLRYFYSEFLKEFFFHLS
jgi:hypothetical protein